ncbi:glucan endo-1,3-alpha-glucosidase, partial [Tremellales sp. Uapishka_1]
MTSSTIAASVASPSSSSAGLSSSVAAGAPFSLSSVASTATSSEAMNAQGVSISSAATTDSTSEAVPTTTGSEISSTGPISSFLQSITTEESDSLSLGLSISAGLGGGSSLIPGTPTSSASSVATTSASVRNGTSASGDKHVFAHFMVGIVSTYAQADWEADMKLAQSKGLTGFALNIGVDWYSQAQLDLAYAAADAVGFSLFISFDFNCQLLIDGKPFVSSFIGDGFDWGAVATGVGKEIYAVPFWQASSANAGNSGLSGLFSWAAWPGQLDNVPVNANMTTDRDEAYLQSTGPVDKIYMAPVSPWFSTHFGNEVSYPKNWLFKSETLWYDRWEEILSMNSSINFIELVTWNDYGESHYIGPYNTPHTDDGSSKWAAGLDHTAMLDFAEPYITAFKQGASTPVITTEQLIYWYRPHLKAAECDSTDNVGSKPTGWDFVSDTVFVAAQTKSGGSVTVTSGNNSPVTQPVGPGVTMLQVPMGVGPQTFEFTPTGGAKASATGNVTISDQCWNGIYNFNFHSGVVSS